MGVRVLIVEDNLANQELMAYLLTAFGHTVLVAENGRKGVEAAGRELPELIICDVQLPDIDGFEVARRLHDNPRLNSIPLVAVTALAMLGDRDRVLAAGFTGYLAKPIDPETFVHQMEAFFPPEKHSVIPSSTIAAASPEPERVSRNVTILAVDNLAVNLDLTRSILNPSGYNVMTASTVAEGLELARTRSCHLILSDVCMPGGSGFDFLLSVRSDPQLRDIPFILITSTFMNEEDRNKGLVLGAARYLFRPIEPETLLAEIRACLVERGID